MLKVLGETAAPIRDGVVDPKQENKLTPDWERWFHRLAPTLGAIPSVLNRVALSTQGAAITATDLTGGLLDAGTYRVGYHARISRAGSVSSSLTVTIAWTEGGVAQSLAGAAITGNTTTTRQNDLYLIRSDAGTAVTYAAAYADGGGATSMQYSLDLSFEQIDA